VSSIFAPLRKELSTYLSREQIDLVYQAYLFSNKAHKEQCRSSGEPYIIHPIAVALILAKMRLDVASIMSAILHDVLEDTDISEEVLTNKFGEEVVKLVDGVTKLDQIHFGSRAEAQAESFRKMILAMVDDIRVILIRLADRLHNARTLHYLDPEKRRRIARETLEIYAPIANRLGMNTFRLEFEELGFAKLCPVRFRILQEAVRQARGNRREVINLIETSLQNALHSVKIANFKLYGREKHLYSIYRKMRSKRLRFSEIMDVYGFRIVVDTVEDCYRALGVVHNVYKPLPTKFKDYIAIPKINGYQSLHTVLFGPYGLPVEIQIRTEDMDKMAENGIAAHWLYKSEATLADRAQLRAREWIKGLLELQRTAGNSLEFIENVRTDLFPDGVYVFTPNGDILELPNGATSVDFAYSVHSDIGDHCVAVKIDRRLSPLSTRLESGQTVEIITAVSACPNPDWLDFVVTGKARSRIHHFLKHQKRSESIELGKRLLERALHAKHKELKDIPKADIRKILSRSGLETLDELFEAIGLGNQMAQIVANRLTRVGMPQVIESDQEELEPLRIRGTEGLVVNFASCCRPVPGDPIEGVMTTEHGIVVHHTDCKNLIDLRKQPDRCILVRWSEEVLGEFDVELEVEVINQRGILASVALAVTNADANIINVNVVEQSGSCNLIDLIITVKDRGHLERVIRSIQHLKDVMKVTRNYNN
jgi:guanosine-3',5'-bis(diphosphate) 3'-pyrophosphohydrolase